MDAQSQSALAALEAALTALRAAAKLFCDSTNDAIDAISDDTRLEARRMQLAEGATDVETAVLLYATAQEVAVATAHQGLDALLQDERVTMPLVGGIPPTMALRIAIKAIFYFLRAYFDRVYTILLFVEGGSAHPYGYGSMSAASKSGNPVAKALTQERPDWLPWFDAFRDTRNAIKDGTNFAVGGAPDPGVRAHFATFGEGGMYLDRTAKGTVTIASLTDALHRAAQLGQVLAVRARNAASAQT